jgi:hypothetical protein
MGIGEFKIWFDDAARMGVGRPGDAQLEARETEFVAI